MSNWILVEDKLPEEGIYVLACIRNKDIAIVERQYYQNRNWYTTPSYGCYDVNVKFDNNSVTHWQPLPEPPTK